MTHEQATVTPSEVVSFWFAAETKPYWFKPTEAFDAALSERFGAAYAQARSGELDGWADAAEGSLALIILLDQIPRNIFRGKPEAYSSDEKAISVANAAIAKGQDKQLDPQQRQFFYLPFMHSERLEDQETGMALYTELGVEETLDYMRRHRDIIARFRRFPHRNETLDRASTEEELAFLEQPGSRF